jgi:predicted TIM-barrel fold metal-dependent hydrolase
MLPPVVDAHFHWRDPLHHPYAVGTDGFDENGNRGGAGVAPYLPDAYFADSATIELCGLVHVEAEWDRADPAGETRWLHALARDTSTRGLPLVVVGWADFTAPDVEALLAAHAAEPLTRGIRQILNRVDHRPDLCWADREYLESDVWRENYALLGKYGLHFELMCFAHQMGPLAALAARHPDIPVHLEHAGLPWDHTPEGRAAWRRGMQTLAALPHADVKISGLGNTVPNWTVDSIRSYVLETIDIFGTDRVAFGSNTPTDKKFSTIADIWAAFDTITAAFSPSERAAMFAGNTLRAYAFPGR